MKFLNKNNKLYQYFIGNDKIKVRSLALFAMLFYCHTAINAQLIRTPVEEKDTLQGGTLIGTPTLPGQIGTPTLPGQIGTPTLPGQIGTLTLPVNQNNSVRPCGTDKTFLKDLEKNPELPKLRQEALMELVKEVDSITTLRKENRLPPEEIIIPVVFHYFYDECAPAGSYESGPPPVYENFRFENAIERLNKDFAGVTVAEWLNKQGDFQGQNHGTLNPYSIYPQRESLISFKLAEKDENGNPTSGINRISNSLTYAGVGDEKNLREVIQWNRNTYLNIYVVEVVEPELYSGIARGPMQTDERFGILTDGEEYDGIAIARWAFDPTFNDGVGEPLRNGYRWVLSHEVGHWLGLRHLWGNPWDHPGTITDFCEIDDFDFYYATMIEFNALNGNGELDLPNLAFNDTPCADEVGGTWNTDPSMIFPCSTASCPEASIDYNLNIMDYSSWGILFTEGQKKFMETLMLTSISQRNEIKGNNSLAFYSDPNNTKRIEFSHGGLFSESWSDNGKIENNEAKIELKGGLEFDISTFPNTNTFPYTLPNTYYNFSAGLPAGLLAEVTLTTDTTATLLISGTATNSTGEFITEFSFNSAGNQPNIFNIVVTNSEMRSKKLKFDFIDVKQKVHENPTYSNVLVGPNSSKWTTMYIEDSEKYVYLHYENNKFILKNTGPVFTQSGKARVFFEGNNISGSLQSGDIEIDVSSLPAEGVFYIGLGTPICNEANPLKSWLKFIKYGCNSISMSAYGVSSIAGRVGKPKLIYSPAILQKNNDRTFNSCEIHLIRSNSNQKFTPGINLIEKVSIVNTYVYRNTTVPYAINGFSKSDLTFTRMSDTRYSISTNTDFNDSFAFELSIEDSAFDGLSTSSPLQQSESLITVLVPTDKTVHYTTLSGESSHSGNLDNAYIFPFVDINTTYDLLGKLEMGFYAYDGGNFAGVVTKGYMQYSNSKFRIESMCQSGSNELELLNYGASINPNNFKLLSDGFYAAEDPSIPTIGGGLQPNSIHISIEEINENLNSVKFVCFKLLYNCNEYYGWVKFLINDDGSLSDFEIAINTIPNVILPIGQLPESCNVDINSSYHFSIGEFRVNESGGFTVFSNPSHNDDINQLYTDYTNEIIPIKLNVTDTYTFYAEHVSTRPQNVGYWQGWVDYNRNGLFESDEQIFCNTTWCGEYSQTLYRQVIFPDHLSGTYNFRLRGTQYYQGSSGCSSIYGDGEVEDYTIQFLSDCPPSLTIEDNLPQGDHKVENYIHIKTNASLYPNQASNMQARYIKIDPNTLIEYGSVFCAEAVENCTSGSPKQTQPELQSTTFKVYPNPFSQQSTVEFEISNESEVNIFVSDITGKKLATLASNEQKTAGMHQVTFDAKGVAAGIYYCTLIADDKIQTQKMVITK